jgi:hypothetical protein
MQLNNSLDFLHCASHYVFLVVFAPPHSHDVLPTLANAVPLSRGRPVVFCSMTPCALTYVAPVMPVLRCQSC